jgi:hypothetical protein
LSGSLLTKGNKAGAYAPAFLLEEKTLHSHSAWLAQEVREVMQKSS